MRKFIPSLSDIKSFFSRFFADSDEDSTTMRSVISRYIKVAMILAILLLAILVIYRTAGIVIFFTAFSILASKLSAISGIPRALTSLVAIPIAAIFVYGLARVFSRDREVRSTGFTIIVACMFVYSCIALAVSTFSPANQTIEVTDQTAFFDRAGNAIVYYSEMPGGAYDFFSSPGYHPQTGQKLMPVNQDMAAQFLRQVRDDEEGDMVHRVTLKPGMDFFDRHGKPLYYYAFIDEGVIELFDRSGYHPRNAAPLLPVTPDIVARISQGNQVNGTYVLGDGFDGIVEQAKRLERSKEGDTE